MPIIAKISDNHEYVVDTSVIKASRLDYATEMRSMHPNSKSDYNKIQEVCFAILSELVRAKIAIDSGKKILHEYQEKEFDNNPNGFPAHWFSLMESRGKVSRKRIQLKLDLCRRMKKRFCLSKIDSCLAHVAEKTIVKQILHRDKGISKASGFIKKHFGVKEIDIMK